MKRLWSDIMDKIFLEATEEIKDIEGGYSNHPADPGGKTKYGITERLARAYGYTGEMRALSWEKARDIYYQEYWIKNKYNQIINRKIAKEVFEQAINLPYIEVNGRFVLKANYHLQKAYNFVSDNQITVDGLVGPQTIEAVNSCSRVIPFFNMLNGLQAKHYLDVVDSNPKLKAFIVGWFNKRIEIKKKGA